jgi:hypothetical protein
MSKFFKELMNQVIGKQIYYTLRKEEFHEKDVQPVPPPPTEYKPKTEETLQTFFFTIIKQNDKCPGCVPDFTP